MGVKENRNGEKTANSGNRQASFGVFLKEALQNPVVRQWLIAIFVFFTLVGILQIDLVPQNYKIKVGEESKYYIVAPRTIINRYQTEEAKRRRQPRLSRRRAGCRSTRPSLPGLVPMPWRRRPTSLTKRNRSETGCQRSFPFCRRRSKAKRAKSSAGP